MKFDWTKYLNLAQDLINSDINEAKQRASISRAYYAAFCVARNYLRDYLSDNNLNNSRRNTNNFNVHQYVTDEFVNRGQRNQKMAQIGRDLGRLRVDRNKADYEDIVANLRSASGMSIRLSKNIIDNIQAIINEEK